jgi:hypothetical protein
VANVLVGRRIPDLNCGLRAVDRTLALRFLPILPDGFSFETTITIAALKDGQTVEWVPIKVRPRIGTSAVRISDGLNTLMLIIRLVSLFAPLRVFVPISLLAFLVGVWYMVESYVLFQEASVKALLAMLGAALFFLFGLLADQVAALRRGEAALRPDESARRPLSEPSPTALADVADLPEQPDRAEPGPGARPGLSGLV